MQQVKFQISTWDLNFWSYFIFFKQSFFCLFVLLCFFSLGTGENFKGFGTIYQSSKLRAEDLRRPEKVPSTIFGFSVCIHAHTSILPGRKCDVPSQGQRGSRIQTPGSEQVQTRTIPSPAWPLHPVGISEHKGAACDQAQEAETYSV